MAATPAATSYEHIALDAAGVPFISGSTMKVVELVVGRLAYGWSPEELHFQHPHLTLGQIYSALAYYADHRQALDEDIDRRLAKMDRTVQQRQPSALVERLRAEGKL